MVDLEPLRASRDLRLLVLGNFVSGLGTQAALVALPYQLYVQTGSAFLTGLLGAVELIPLVTMALLGGAIADRADRRRVLLLDQIALVACSAALAALAFAGSPPVGVLYVLGGLLAGFGALQNVTRSAILPNLVEPARLRSAIALSFGLYQLTMVIGPGIGGVLIGVLGVGTAYAVDAASCLAMVWAVVVMAPQPPQTDAAEHPPVLRSIADGLRYVRGNHALVGSFAIDLVAMTFGMPRALFAVLAVSVYHAGAEGTGLLYAAVSAGATIAALTTGWIEHARRLGVIVIWAVVVWGAAIALVGVVGSLWLGRRAARGGRGGRQRQRGVPQLDQPDGHARRDARAHVIGLLAGGDERAAAGRRRVGHRRRPHEPALLGHLGRPGLHRGRRGGRRRLPGARALRRRRGPRGPARRLARTGTRCVREDGP